jgi:GTP1/Obg family GTP-binding protein
MCVRPEKDAYLHHLQALPKVRDVCEGELNLPQICVVGDQSSGKSSLLACITGIDLPVK